jgi:hypothetical protein
MCKVQWSHHTEVEAMWEHEQELKHVTPNYSRALAESHWRDSFKGGMFVTPAFCNNKILSNL